MYTRDEAIGKDSNIVYKTKAFDMPIRKDRKGNYKYPGETIFNMCFSSDFFIEEADAWRREVLDMISIRSDCEFFCITKRPERIMECIPNIEEYSNLKIYCTMENQKRFDERAPVYLNLPLNYKGVMIEPILEDINLSAYIDKIDLVSVGGESGAQARVCDFKWVENIRSQCIDANVDFHYHQTGAKLLLNGRIYNIPRNRQESQARLAFKK